MFITEDTKQASFLKMKKPEVILTEKEKAYPATPLSFQLVKKALSDEYQRRAFLPEVKRTPVNPLMVLSEKERESKFKEEKEQEKAK